MYEDAELAYAPKANYQNTFDHITQAFYCNYLIENYSYFI